MSTLSTKSWLRVNRPMSSDYLPTRYAKLLHLLTSNIIKGLTWSWKREPPAFNKSYANEGHIHTYIHMYTCTRSYMKPLLNLAACGSEYSSASRFTFLSRIRSSEFNSCLWFQPNVQNAYVKRRKSYKK